MTAHILSYAGVFLTGFISGLLCPFIFDWLNSRKEHRHD